MDDTTSFCKLEIGQAVAGVTSPAICEAAGEQAQPPACQPAVEGGTVPVISEAERSD